MRITLAYYQGTVFSLKDRLFGFSILSLGKLMGYHSWKETTYMIYIWETQGLD